jgi:hypothetical protein
MHLQLILRFMQSIKQLTDSFSVCGLYEQSVYLTVCAVRGSAYDPPSMGCKGMYNMSIAPVGIVVLLQKHPCVCLPTGLASRRLRPVARGQVDGCLFVVCLVFTRRRGAGIPRGEFFAPNRGGSQAGEERREREGPRTVARRCCWHSPSTTASA